MKARDGFDEIMSKLLNKARILFEIIKDLVRLIYTSDSIEKECSVEDPCPLCRIDSEFLNKKDV